MIMLNKTHIDYRKDNKDKLYENSLWKIYILLIMI